MAKKKFDPKPADAVDPVPVASVLILATLKSGTVDDDGNLTAVDALGIAHKLAPGTFEALGNDLVRFLSSSS